MKGVIVTIFVGSILLAGFALVYLEILISKGNRGKK